MATPIALGTIGGKIGSELLGLKKGGAVKKASKKKGSSKKFKMPIIDKGSRVGMGPTLLKKGGKVKRGGRGRVKR